jgi:glucosamine--fructose-6-phosphate aminotransferase (isomerizing)
MCGIVAVLARRSTAAVPDPGELIPGAAHAWASLRNNDGNLAEAADQLVALDQALRGVSGIRALLGTPELGQRLERRTANALGDVARIEAELDAGRHALEGAELEAANAAIIRLKDAVWAIRHDRLPAATAVAELAGSAVTPTSPGLEAWWALHVTLSALERLEVRGRDSAGVHVFVTGGGIDRDDPEVAARLGDPLFRSASVRPTPEGLAFVYKAAAEIGELGDNIRVLRAAIAGDDLLHRALGAPEAQAAIVAHTRWASVGLISEANAHPLNQEEQSRPDGPYVAAALNGDVDNHMELRAAHSLSTRPEITTDAKVIPVLVSRRIAAGTPVPSAFRETVAAFEGSVAIAAHAGDDPDRLLLALRGSGQALYVGLADDAFVVTSEPYGLIEETPRYLRMDGEATGGQIVVLDRAGAGGLEGVERVAYDGSPLPVAPAEVVTAEITTRDVDRAGYPHFLLKEISEAPTSFRKTLRGKITETNGRRVVALTDETLPADLRQKLAKGAVRRIFAIGQGTSAVAAQSLATALSDFLPPGITVSALPSTELSGFGLDDDMGDTLVVAISQSGTTTDTNRTVDLARARGAAVVAIVNRRHSDLVEKSDGVLYTSDGRDVEMSVPSTKAFYAQVAAGFLLALALATEVRGGEPPPGAHDVLVGLADLPAAMEQVLGMRPAIAAAAGEHAPRRRYWAVVGNGVNRVAAAELRIKLSELAYKSIACDATEDKKHIDLSSEPLILVCATGLPPAAAADVAKELAIYRAHRAAPVVIATEGTDFPAALATLPTPPVHPALVFVVSAMAGHLFAYEAALAIDAQAKALRRARAVVEEATEQAERPGYDLLTYLAPRLEAPAREFTEGLTAGAYDGSLPAAVAVRLASVLRHATGDLPLELYEPPDGRLPTPAAVVEELAAALTRAIEELSRPIDAIKHQAKTVTVGISRSEEALFTAPLVAEVLAAGTPRDRLGYRALRTLGALGPAVEEVVGFTRYAVDGNPEDGASITVVAKGGIARDIRSRAESPGGQPLRGTKHRATTLREVTVAKGGIDGRTVVIVPETRRADVVGITLLHARFADRLPGAEMRAVLEGYQGRYGAIVDAVTETEPVFDDERLGTLAPIDLLTVPVHVLAQHWRG